jgi:hypothetical protein
MGFNPTRSRLHPFAMVITAFDMGSHDVLQVLGRSGRVSIARTPPPPPPSAKESKSALRTPFEPGCVLHERGRIAACRRIAAEGDPCDQWEEVLRRPATSTRHWRRGLFLKQTNIVLDLRVPRTSREAI